MAINWNQILPWQGSQSTAFEELCCQLARHEDIAGKKEFIRKGTPDAGVECYWLLDNGGEHAWQAKYFQTTLTSAQWGQIKDSFETTISKHPALKVYYVCIPQDRPDARIDNQQSFLDKWNDHVMEWQALATQKGMNVEVRYWGTHEIFERLSKDENAGRLRFWFNRQFPSKQWFDDKLQESYTSVSSRYTPELNVDLPIVRVFDAMGCTPAFVQKIDELCGNCIKKFKRLYGSIDGEKKEEYEKKYEEIRAGVSFIFLTLNKVKSSINWVDFQNDCSKLLEVVYQTTDLLNYKNNQGRVSTIQYELNDLSRAVNEALEYTQECKAEDIPKRAILLLGEAGSGKTHLLCDIARRYSEASIPSILLLGSQFRDFEPRTQIQMMLQLQGNLDQFLSELNTLGETIGSRILFMIDALNEGPGRNLWKTYLPAFTESIRRYEWLCLVVSIRTTYVHAVIDDNQKGRFIKVTHNGFATVEYEAVTKFFIYYGLQIPTMPLLLPEYRNPLFLKLICQGIQNKKLTKLPEGINGLVDLLSFYVDSADQRFNEISSTDPKKRIIYNAIHFLASAMVTSTNRYLPRDEASEILHKIHPTLPGDYYKSLLFFLTLEGILSEEIIPCETGRIEVLRFTYERFSDFLIAQDILNKSYSKLWRKIRRKSPLNKYLKDEHSYWNNLGIVESLINLVPEKHGMELFELIPKCRTYSAVADAFVNSVIWRKPNSINEKTSKFVNEVIIKKKKYLNKFFASIFYICSVEHHPFNADTLHRFLWKMPLAHRDSWWSIFIHEQYRNEQSIVAILDWVFAKTNKATISAESMRLLCTLLCWFLTSSNRFLRDRTTKALVLLLTNRIDVLLQILKAFHGVNDPYISERIYGVALGGAVCSTDTSLFEQLGRLVFEQVFNVDEVISNILLRDYARGLLEYIRRKGFLENLDFGKITPPYKSTFRLPNLSAEELDKCDDLKAYESENEKTMMFSLHHSVFHDDFATYIVKHNINWLNARFDEPLPQTKSEQRNTFVESFSTIQRAAWEDYQSVSETANRASFVEHILQWKAYDKSDNLMFEEDDLLEKQEESEQLPRHIDINKNLNVEELRSIVEVAKAEVEQREADFIALLSHEQKHYYYLSIKPYLGLRESDEHELIDPKIIEYWIFKRVMELGWTNAFFGRFDKYINYHDYGRHANKAERIGKKYQWIAFYEILAYLSDNYIYKNRYYDKQKQYNGPWQLSSLRNIDPTCTLREDLGDNAIQCWWNPVSYDNWIEHASWLKQTDDLPDARQMIDVHNPSDNSDWLVLEGNAEWAQPTPVDKETYEDPSPRIWYQIRSYIVKLDDVDSFFTWAKEQNFMGRWMPESLDKYHLFLGEFYWAQAYQDSFEFDDEWVEEDRNEFPCKVHVPVINYVQESSGYDCSIIENINIALPSKKIVLEMGLHLDAINYRYIDATGRVIAFDPSIYEAGPGALLVRKDAFMKYLAGNGYAVIWTLLGEKNIIQSRSNSGLGRLEISGAFSLEGHAVTGSYTALQKNY